MDALCTDVPPLRHASPAERTGFPTQKPRALLDRIVGCATPPGGLVVDLFAGSGTTGESAWSLGRRFVLGDASPLAIATARSRLLRASVPLVVQECPARAPAHESPGLRLDVTVKRRARGVLVALREPLEPLAWAVDGAYEEKGPFRVAWHSERAPGTRSRPAEREALLERARGPVAVRVWYDDGSVPTRIVGVP